MRTLIVLRHAKAVTQLGLADIDRPLAERGKRDSTATGEWLAANGLRPDRVLCSPSQRTRETLQRLELDAEVSIEPGIYDNDADVLLDLVRETDPEVTTLLLVGHNPSMHELVHDLTREAPDRFPTCALAQIEFADDWSAAGPALGRLVVLRTPKG